MIELPTTQFKFAHFGALGKGEVQLDIGSRTFVKASDEFGWLEMKYSWRGDDLEPVGRVYVTDDFGKLVKTTRPANFAA